MTVPPHLSLCSLVALAMTACAGAPPQPGDGLRVLVKLVQPAADAAAIAAQASAASGRSVRYLAATSEQWHALRVPCADTADCNAVLQRLRADTRHFAYVQLDDRKRIVSP